MPGHVDDGHICGRVFEEVIMCAGCKYCQFEECTCEDYRMTKEDIDKIEDGTYYAENCPFYEEVIPDLPGKYWREND